MSETFTFEEAAAPQTFSFEEANQPDLSGIKISPYETQRMQQPMGPFGPLNPSEVLALPDILKAPAAALEETGIPASISEIAADFLKRSGIDPSAEPGKNLADIKALPLARIPGTDISPLDAISPEFRKGIEERAGQLVSGLTEPGQLATLPFASLKPVLAAFALQAGAAVPGDVEEILRGRNPREVAAALTSALANTAIATTGMRGEPSSMQRGAAELERAVRSAALPSVEELAIRGGRPLERPPETFSFEEAQPAPVQTSEPAPTVDALHTPGAIEGPEETSTPESGPGATGGAATVLPADRAIARVAAMGPDEFFSFAQGGKARESYALGRALETPEQLQALAEARTQSDTEINALKQKARTSGSMEDLTAMSKLVGKHQYFNEAYGAATGTGSAGEFLRQTDPSYRPPFPEVPSQTAIAPHAASVAEVPVAKIRLSEDVPNFKAESSAETGVVKGQELQGKFERLGTAPIVVWRRLNGDLEVITGRHRLDLAKRSGEKTIPAQIVDEAKGFTVPMALKFDAEANIRDGQGSVEDYAHYFQNSPGLTEEEARSRGLLSRAKGNSGWDLGRNASDDLRALWRSGKVSEAQAVAIARAAPAEARLQRVGVQAALRGEKPEILSNLVRVAQLETAGKPEQLDLLGTDDSAMKQMQNMARRAANAQRTISEQIRAVQGAAKRPELARELGVDVGDPQALLQRVEALKALQARWQNWPMHPDLVDQVKGPATPPPGDLFASRPSGSAFSGFRPPLIPSSFTTLSDVVNYRKAHLSAELEFYKSLGLSEADASKMLKAADNRSNISVENVVAKLSPEALAKLESFETGEGGHLYQYDRRYNPEELEKDGTREDLARKSVAALTAGDEPSEFGDRLIYSAAALGKLRDFGGTWSDIARALDRYTTEISGSQGDKAEIFKLYGERIRNFATKQGVRLPQGDLGPSIAGEQAGKVLNSPSLERTVHAMATGVPAPLRRRGKPSPPALPAPPARLPAPVAPLPVPKVGPIRALWTRARIGLQSVVSPQNIDPAAKAFSHIMREYGAQAALDAVRADDHIGELRGFFDKTPVAKDYQYDPNQPLPYNYAVMDAFERNRASLPARLQDLARAFDDEFGWRVAAVQKIKPNAMQTLLADYFPHLWENPDHPNTKAIMAEVAAKAPWEGSKAFMKQRTVQYFHEGLARGLKPISDNPIDLLEAKMHQMDKFLAANKTFEETKANGMAKYYPLGRKIPGDRVVVDDPAFTVHAPPFLEVREAFDAGIRRGLVDFMAKMGFAHERVAKMKVNTWGQYETGTGKIQSRFGGPDFVIMHEIGHGLEERYGLSQYLLSNDPLRQEMKALANLRTKGAATVSRQFHKYIQTPDEQVANAVHAYIYAPEAMAKVAPTVQTVLRNIIRAHPELEDLNAIKPGLALGSETGEMPLAGPVLAGHWTLPTGPAAVLKNYLSPGLSRWMAYRTLRAASNIINAAQLGLSGFHVGFTSLDATVSSVATGMGYLLRGDLKRAAKSFAFAPVAPVANYYVGKAVQMKMIDPAATHVPIGFPKLGLGAKLRLSPAADLLTRQIAELAVKGGLRAEIDPFWKTNITRSLVRAWHAGGMANYGKAALQLPLAMVEQSMRPIAEYLVPRQKLGVFAQLALQEMNRIGWNARPEEVRAAMARAADWTEDRMGQMTYDSMFLNKSVKDAMLLSLRAFGWQLGKYRHLYGVGADTASLVKGLIENGVAASRGKPMPASPQITNRMLYPVALTAVVATVGGLLHRMFTGSNPQTLQDYFFPRTGRQDKDGRDERMALPSYVKDVAGEEHSLRTSWMEKSPIPFATEISHKLNPFAGIVGDMWNNKDYYGVEIRHPDDPLSKRMADLALFAVKQFTPFSISGTSKLAEDKAPIAQLLLPFIGVVPAKKALFMSPAQTLSADITREGMGVGGRTREAFDHSQLLKSIVQDIRQNGQPGQVLPQAMAAGQLRAADAHTIESMLTTTPLQYQVGRMSPENAMRVWRLANAAERQELGNRLAAKIANSRTLEAEKQSAYLKELVRSGAAPKLTP